MKQIKVTIYANGYVQAETVGIKGQQCEEFRPLLENILQNRVVDQAYTDEFYEMALEETYVNEMEKARI